MKLSEEIFNKEIEQIKNKQQFKPSRFSYENQLIDLKSLLRIYKKERNKIQIKGCEICIYCLEKLIAETSSTELEQQSNIDERTHSPRRTQVERKKEILSQVEKEQKILQLEMKISKFTKELEQLKIDDIKHHSFL